MARNFGKIRKIILNIFWTRTFEISKRAKLPLSLVIKINQHFHQELFPWTAIGALIWVRQFLHWFDHQTKPSIPLLYYFCNPLYRSACIAVIVIILSLYWRLFYCELLGLGILFYTVASVQGVTSCGFQQGCSWNTQWVSVWFLVLLWVQQWSTTGCSEMFLGYTMDSV